MTNHNYLTMAEFARQFGLSVRQLQRLLNKIGHKRSGGKVSPEEQEYLHERIHQYELKKLYEQNRKIEESRKANASKRETKKGE